MRKVPQPATEAIRRVEVLRARLRSEAGSQASGTHTA